MQTFKPVTHVRIQAVQFTSWDEQFWNKYPMRYIIEDDALNKGHYELWVERKKSWDVIEAKDWIVVDEDEIGFYVISGLEFHKQYELVTS